MCLNDMHRHRFTFTIIVDVISRLEPVTSHTKAGSFATVGGSKLLHSVFRFIFPVVKRF